MITLPDRFDDIRPYYDSEVPEAMQRIASDPLLLPVLRFFNLEERENEFREALRGISSTAQLQEQVMKPALEQIVRQTIDILSFEGIDDIPSDRGLLYVSNHRDIVLDAFLQQLAILRRGLSTSHITFGSNLMQPQFVADLGLCNKMFRTVRKSADYQEFMESSIHLSDYINYVVSHGESVWIAQRNGRTKDGRDKTEPGLLRMLLLGSKRRDSLDTLGITPVSVSYQWEPCAILKAVELFRSRDGKPYVKAPGEDLNSIVTGIVTKKGSVDIAVSPVIDTSIFGEILGRDDILKIASMIDEAVYGKYHIWDTNFAAYDMLHKCRRFAGLYQESLKEEFESRMRHDIEPYVALDRSSLTDIYLSIYASPIDNSPLYRRN